MWELGHMADLVVVVLLRQMSCDLLLEYTLHVSCIILVLNQNSSYSYSISCTA